MISFWWIILLLGILGWTSLYWFFSHLNRNKKAEWHCRLVTLIHGTLVSVLSAWNAFVVGPWPLTDLGEPNTREQEVTLAISLSYFLFDQVWCILHKAEGSVMLLHHVTTIVILSLCLCSDCCGCEIVAGIGVGEASNPVLQLRWFMLESGWKDTWQINTVDCVFVIIFLYMRLYVGTRLLIAICTDYRPTTWMKVGVITMYLISIAFIAMVARFAYKKFKKIKELTCLPERKKIKFLNGSMKLENGTVSETYELPSGS